MKVSEILDFEKNNTQKIYLLKEGIFWRAYESSAMLFSKYIKEYKLIKKFIKIAQQEIVYMGFPAASLNSILETVVEKGFNIEKQSDVLIVLADFSEVFDFEKWKSEITIIEKEKQIDKKEADSLSCIIGKIKNYPLLNKSPLEAMGFVAEIQKEIESL